MFTHKNTELAKVIFVILIVAIQSTLFLSLSTMKLQSFMKVVLNIRHITFSAGKTQKFSDKQ